MNLYDAVSIMALVILTITAVAISINLGRLADIFGDDSFKVFLVYIVTLAKKGRAHKEG